MSEIYDLIKLWGPNNKKMDYELGRRDIFTQKFSWAVPSEEVINEIKHFVGQLKVLEVGAGLGLWCYLLKLKGCDIIATDNFSSHFKNYDHKFCDIENLDAVSALKKYSDKDVLMLVWPPYLDSMAYDALKLFKGNKLVYVGEPEGDACATDDFFELLNKEWKLVKEIKIPRWFGMHDLLFLYEK